jgi:hypothetical protein
MKKQLLYVVGLIATLAFAVPNSQAQIVAYEGFNYAPASAINGQAAPAPMGTWGFNGSTANALAGSLSYGALITSAGQAQSSGGGRPVLTLGSFADTSGVQYVSFLGNTMGTGLTGYSMLEFNNGATTIFSLGGSNDSNSNGEFTMDRQTGFVNSGVLRGNATTFFVAKIDYTGGAGADVVTYWVNPTVGGAETVSALTATGTFNFDRIAFANFTPTRWNLDEVRFGTTWASVTPVPEPSTYALLALGLGALFFLRRRRAA